MADGRRHGQALSPYVHTLVTEGTDGTLDAWDLRTEALQWALPVKPGVAPVNFSPKGTMVAARGADGIVHLWDARTRVLLRGMVTCWCPASSRAGDCSCQEEGLQHGAFAEALLEGIG